MTTTVPKGRKINARGFGDAFLRVLGKNVTSVRLPFPELTFKKTIKPELITGSKVSPGLFASATVEAVLIMPVVLMLLMFELWMLELFYIHSEIGSELNSIGSEMVAASYAYSLIDENPEETVTEIIASVGWSEIYVKSRLKGTNVGERIKYMTTLLSDFESESTIDLTVTYKVEPLFTVPGIDGIWLTNHFHSKSYVGFIKETGDEDDEMVYVTRYGNVYHTDLECRALRVRIESVPTSEVGKKRNEDGCRYYPCSTCGGEPAGVFVYITPYGTRYHTNRACSQLRVDIFEIPLSSVGSRTECLLCP